MYAQEEQFLCVHCGEWITVFSYDGFIKGWMSRVEKVELKNYFTFDITNTFDITQISEHRPMDEFSQLVYEAASKAKS